jgi:hypothetical protein
MIENLTYEKLKQQIDELNEKVYSLEDQIALLNIGRNVQKEKQIKVPILLAKVGIDMAMDKEVILPYPIRSLSHVDWEIKELNCSSPAMTNKLFVDGKLRVHIYYNSMFPPYPVLSVIEEISFKKRKDFHYLHPPLPTHPVQNKEYSYVTDLSSNEVITHREKKMSVNEQIQCDLSYKHIISSEAMEIKENKTIIYLQGSLTLLFNVLQQQWIPFF